jgi:hypothetical protein
MFRNLNSNNNNSIYNLIYDKSDGGGGSGGGGSVSFKREIFDTTAGQTHFTLLNTPSTNSEFVDVNGQIVHPGINRDYVLIGNVITFNYGLAEDYSVMVTYV